MYNMQISSTQRELCLHKISSPKTSYSKCLLPCSILLSLRQFYTSHFCWLAFTPQQSKPKFKTAHVQHVWRSYRNDMACLVQLARKQSPREKARAFECFRKACAKETASPSEGQNLPIYTWPAKTAHMCDGKMSVFYKKQKIHTVLALKSNAMSHSHTPVMIYQLISRV